MAFFRELLSTSEKNKLTPEKITEIMSECLIGEDSTGTLSPGHKGTFSHTGRQRRLSPAKSLKDRQLTLKGAGSLFKPASNHPLRMSTAAMFNSD